MSTDWIPVFAQVVALTALLVTLISTRWTLTSQRDIKLTEIKAELFAKSRQLWVGDFRTMTAELLALCDPDDNSASVAEGATRNRDIMKAVHSLSLYLDPRDADHLLFERAIIRLSMEAQPKYASDRGGDSTLHASSDVIAAAKVVLKKEMKWLEDQFRKEKA